MVKYFYFLMDFVKLCHLTTSLNIYFNYFDKFVIFPISVNKYLFFLYQHLFSINVKRTMIFYLLIIFI